MDYNFRESIEKLLEDRRRTKKSLYEQLKMTGQGFDAMLKNNTISAVKLAQIAEFFEVPVSHFYGNSTNAIPADTNKNSFGEQTVLKMAEDINELRHFFEEEIRVKNIQIAGLQRTVDVLVGKSEGAIDEPLSVYALTIFDLLDQYKLLAMGKGVITAQKLNKCGSKVGGTPFSYAENTVINK